MMSCPFCGSQPVITRSSDIVTYREDVSKPWKIRPDGKSWTRPMVEVGREQSWHLTCGNHVSMFGRSKESLIKRWETRSIA